MTPPTIPILILQLIAVAHTYWHATPAYNPARCPHTTPALTTEVTLTNTTPSTEPPDALGWAEYPGCHIWLTPSTLIDLIQPLDQTDSELGCLIFLHESGHNLGYTHTTDPASVMYPTLEFSKVPPICIAWANTRILEEERSTQHVYAYSRNHRIRPSLLAFHRRPRPTHHPHHRHHRHHLLS